MTALYFTAPRVALVKHNDCLSALWMLPLLLKCIFALQVVGEFHQQRGLMLT